MRKLSLMAGAVLVTLLALLVKGNTGKYLEPLSLDNTLAVELGLPSNTDATVLQEFLRHRELIADWIVSLNDNGPTASSPRLPSLTCTACRAAAGLLLSLLRQGVSFEELLQAVANVCVLLQIAPPTVCRGLAENYTPVGAYILQERPYLSVNDFCGFFIQDEKCGVLNATFTNWDISLDGNKPPVMTRPLLPPSKATVPVLHLTDIHLDLEYVEGSHANCVGLMCCREPLPENSSRAEGAGHFGSYLCDFPLHSVDNLFEDAAGRYPNYEFVLLTGDYVHHGIWETTVEGNMGHNAAVAKTINRLFPDTNVYPVLGNHEGQPCNIYAPRSVWGVREDFDLSWLFNQIPALYSNYLPEEAIGSFQNYGYYTVSPSPGLRLVVLNTNICYVFNFWIFYESADPAGQLQWLADTLQEAEEKGEIVYIAGHVPPGHGHCWAYWAEKFDGIINRFENIIRAQFYGHTHQDDLKIFFEGPDSGAGEEGPRPTNSLYIGASATTYTNLNPGYKVYHVDGALSTEGRTWEILDHETYIYNLTLANARGEGVSPEWFKLYEARQAYGLTGLRPEDLYGLVVRMVNDEAMFQLWLRHYRKAGGGRSGQDTCEDAECRLSYLCDTVTTNVADQSHCQRLRSLLKGGPSTATSL